MYGVPETTYKRRHIMKKPRYVNAVNAPWRNATFSDDIERILADRIIMLEEHFGGS
jgi:hypothetical protein